MDLPRYNTTGSAQTGEWALAQRFEIVSQQRVNAQWHIPVKTQSTR